MRKTLLLITILFISAASFALSDMVSVDFIDGSRTVPIEDLKDMYYSNTKDSFYLALEDTTYAFKADSSLHVTFLDSIEGQHKREREALIAIYKALDGDNWHNNTNWCSDKPLSEWAGVGTEDGFVVSLQLECNNLHGNLPDEVANLEFLYILNIAENDILYISDKIQHLSVLQKLDLPRIKYLPKEILSMANIVELRIDLRDCSNDIERLDFSGMLNLWGLELYADKMEFPIGLQALSNLYHLNLYGFIGDFPDVSNCTELRRLSLHNSSVDSTIPKWLANLTNLEMLHIEGLGLKGEIPREIYSLPNLQSIILRENKLEGTLPIEMVDYFLPNNTALRGFSDYLFNNLCGPIPQEIQMHPSWCNVWQDIVFHNKFNIKELYLPGPNLSGVDVCGDSIDSKEVYAQNAYTILWDIPVEYATWADWNLFQLTEIYEKYKDKNIEILYSGSEFNSEEQVRDFKESNDVPFRCFVTDPNATNRISINDYRQTSFLKYYLNPDTLLGNHVMVVDSTGKTVFISPIEGNSYQLDQFLYRNLCKDSIDYYVSSDYSQHMLVDTLQMATVGKGIDIVLMGDAYSDRQIADSTYHKDLKYLYENLFTEEPYKSYKEMFNVFIVNVVSPTEGYEHGSTALGGFFGYETEVGGNDGAVIEYASLAVEYEKLDNAIVIVAMNSDKYAGTCYMYYPSDTTITFGSGLSISYFPKGGDTETFAQLLHHEALGHGFAKLADEYAYEEFGAVPESTVALHQEQQSNWGWWKNIDFTNDPASIRWSRLLLDERYQYDGLGAFEGGLTYWTGVWRPTENSIMRYNTGGFNAPSREAIYYRIHKLAYGDEWEYDYEKFVEWDAKNRKKADSPLLMPSREAIRNIVPTHPPVIKQMNWREALESEQTPQRSQIKAKEGAPVYDKSINQLPNTNKYVFTTYLNDEQ